MGTRTAWGGVQTRGNPAAEPNQFLGDSGGLGAQARADLESSRMFT